MSPKPSLPVLNVTSDRVLLLCEVPGTFPRPTLQFQGSRGNVLPAVQTQVSQRHERFYVSALTDVTRGDHYCCVVTQEAVKHVTFAQTFVPFCGEDSLAWGRFEVAQVNHTVCVPEWTAEDGSSPAATGWWLV